MTQTEYGLEHLGDLTDMLLARHAGEAVLRRAHLGRETERLVDLESGEVDIVLLAVNDIATMVSLDLRGRKRVVVNGAFDTVVLLALIR